MSFNRDPKKVSASAPSVGGDPLRVMVVDDSAVVRGLETKILEGDPDLKVVASVANGQSAIQALDHYDVEVVVLDIEMPVMDGLTALPKLLEKKPHMRVIVSSTLTQKNADISLRALELGATDYVLKPTSSRDLIGAGDFQTLLREKTKALGMSARRAKGGAARPFTAAVQTGRVSSHVPFSRGGATESAEGAPVRTSLLSPTKPIVLREAPNMRPDVITIGSSTGGPQALFTVLSDLKKLGGVSQPILITQHMPATFTAILAEHITRISGLNAKEASEGDTIENHMIYIAPGEYHMLIEIRGREKIVHLDQGAPENFCRPAVDPMFRSIAKAYGKKVLAAVLTGMGSDGAKGGSVIVNAGGAVIAQDEQSSVVWGMPGATAQAGICSAVLPIGDVASYIHKFATRLA